MDKNLNKELEDNFIEKVRDIDSNFKQIIKKDVKKTFIKVTPLFLGCACSIVFKTPIFLGIGSGITASIALKEEIKKTINEYRNIKENNSKELEDNLSDLETTIDNFEKTKKTNLIDIKDKNQLSSHYNRKEEDINQVIEDLDLYLKKYNLPPFLIKNEDLFLTLDTTYCLFEIKNIEKEYYDSMSKVIKNCFARILLEGKKEIFIGDLIRNFNYLESENINKKEIISLQNEIINLIGIYNIIQINNEDNNNFSNDDNHQKLYLLKKQI